MGNPILVVDDLRVEFATPLGTVRALRGLSFSVEHEEIFGLVGESGCGKTMTGRSILRMLPTAGEITDGKINFDGRDITRVEEKEMREIRGRRIAMIFQDPSASLNPVFTIGQQIMEVIRQHRPVEKSDLRRYAIEILNDVELPDPKAALDAYPHQLSGGMQQRAMIALALSSNPDLLIADEPTTALDVTIQAQILDLLRRIKAQRELSIILITHNLGVVADICHRVAIVYAGRVVETGPVEQIFRHPKHPYTLGLLASVPRLGTRGSQLQGLPGTVPRGSERIIGCAFAPRCAQVMEVCREKKTRAPTGGRRSKSRLLLIRRRWGPVNESDSAIIQIADLSAVYKSGGGLFGRDRTVVRAVDGLSLDIRRGETLSVVGESGCGKTTLGLTLLRLVQAEQGHIYSNGYDLLGMSRSDLRKYRRQMQIVFQNPTTSLNPRMNIKDIVAEPLVTHTKLRDEALIDRVVEVLEEVGMGEEHLLRMPHQVSGGQAQRVAIARAIALEPTFLVLDEPTSALDVSVQAQILNMLMEIQERHQLTYLFITHDLGVVEHISDRVAVMYLGQIVELGPVEAIFADPKHPYTQALLSSTLVPDLDLAKDRIILEGSLPSPADPPSGCRFHTRCPFTMDICVTAEPSQIALSEGHWATCHLLAEED